MQGFNCASRPPDYSLNMLSFFVTWSLSESNKIVELSAIIPKLWLWIKLEGLINLFMCWLAASKAANLDF